MKTDFFKDRRLIFLLAIIIVVLGLALYFATNSTTEDLTTNGSDVNIGTGDATPTPPVIPLSSSSSLSPISPLSPVSTPTRTVTDPRVIQEMADKALSLYEKGEYENAIKLLNEILVIDPDNIFVYDLRGTVYTALSDPEKALADYSRAIKLNEVFAQPYYNRGRVYLSLERYDDAINDLQKSAELDPERFGYRSNGNIGLIYHQLGEYDKALEAFEASISHNVDEKADVYYFRGETYTALEDYDAAIADYEAAIERFTQYGEAYKSLGYAYYKTGQFDKAMDSLNQALDIAPDNPIAHLYLALVYLATDHPDEAISAASEGVNSINILSDEEQNFIFARILTDLETVTQEQPDKSETAEAIIDLIPTQ